MRRKVTKIAIMLALCFVVWPTAGCKNRRGGYYDSGSFTDVIFGFDWWDSFGGFDVFEEYEYEESYFESGGYYDGGSYYDDGFNGDDYYDDGYYYDDFYKSKKPGGPAGKK